jgi:hypothetical protein
MDEATRSLLAEIGEGLDQHRFPRVYNGGFVLPEQTAVLPISGEETNDGSEGTGGSAAGSWQGTAGWQGPPSGPGQADYAEPPIGKDCRARNEAEVREVAATYRNVAAWFDDTGLWLRSESAVLPGLEKTAFFLTRVPFAAAGRIRTWAFWRTPISFEWIGPRHTNRDGSVCSYDDRDGTWTRRDPLIELLGLHTLWALRHLHQEVFRRWPGHHSAMDAVERLSETGDEEFCGCDAPRGWYQSCCKKDDLARLRSSDPNEVVAIWRGLVSRRPPQAVIDFAIGIIGPAEASRALSASTRIQLVRFTSGLSRIAIAVALTSALQDRGGQAIAA